MRTIDPIHWSHKRKKLPLSTFAQKAPTRLETLIRRSLMKAVLEFCRSTQVKGNRLQHDEETSEFERRIWQLILWAVLLTGIGTSVLLAVNKRAGPALRVALPSLEHNIQNINFPAIALCDYYAVYNVRTLEYAQYLHENKGHSRAYRNYTVDYIQSHLMHFGALINFDLPDLSPDFMDFIRFVDGDRGWNITKIMMHLNFPCSERLLRCSWRGFIKPCEELFAMRLTQWGLCCVFNSRYHLEDLNNKPYILDKINQDNGLAVVVKREKDDFGYTRRTGTGTEVLLFDGDEYPLMEGGAVVSLPASLNRSTFIVLTTKDMEATKEVHYVSKKRRGCQFNKEETYIHCLVACRKATIKSLCGCTPFQYLPSNDTHICSLNQLTCLNKYREKLLYYYPTGEPDPALQEEFSDSLSCECVPDCIRTRYSVHISFAKFSDANRNKTFRNAFVNNMEVADTSIIRIFYSTEGQRLYSVEVNERWYELISIIGSQFSVALGITIILGCELTFFLTIRWWIHFNKMRKLHT